MESLNELVRKLEHAFSGRLVSIILYGSAASIEHLSDKLADLNVLCALKEITPRELADAEPILRWWRAKGHPSPLLMSEEEVHNSADSFPIEFRDMKDRRKVLYGPDLIADLTIDPVYYRAEVEHDLRSKLLRLRQQGAQRLSDPEKLLALCVESVSTFCILGRHALVISGAHAKSDRRAVVHQLAQTIRADMAPFEKLLDIREDKSGADLGDPGELFAQYLVCIGRIIAFVNDLEERKL